MNSVAPSSFSSLFSIIRGHDIRLWVVGGGKDHLAANGTDTPQRQVFAAVLVVGWLALFLIRKWRKEKTMRLPPGPRGVPLLGNLPFLDGNNLHRHLADLASTYGHIFSLRLGRKLCVVVSSPALAKEILKEKDAIFANHDVPSSALVLPNGLHGMAWAPHGAQWRMLRKLSVAEMLNHTRLQALSEVRTGEVHRMVRRIYDLNAQPAEPRPVAIREMLFSTLFDVLTAMLWGSDTLKADPAMREMGEEFRRVVQQILGSFGQLGISDFFPFLAPFDLQGLERERRKIADRLHRILDAIIDHKRATQSAGTDTSGTSKEFLAVLLKMEEKARADSTAPLLTRNHIKGLVMDLVMAGMDTTAVTSEWVMAELVKNPEAMKRVQDELDRVVGVGTVEEAHLGGRLRYLSAVVKEAMRLHPAAPLMLPRTPSESCSLGGYSVPQGTRVLVNMWAIGRDPEVWDRPEEFDPERFLGDDRKWDFSGNDLGFFPFGSGRRICPGAPFADRMLALGLAALLHTFDWRLPDDCARLDLEEKFGMVLKKARPLLLVPTPRVPLPPLSDASLLSGP